MPDSRETAQSELAFQSAYARLLTDSSFRGAVFSEEPLNECWQIESEIVERLRGLDHGRTSMFAKLLLGNRMGSLSDALPNSAFLLGPQLQDVVHSFSDASPPADHRKYPEARAFAHYLLDRLEKEQLGPPYLHDVLTYELSTLQLRLEYDEPFWFDGAMTSTSEFVAALKSGRPIYLHRHPYQAVLSFSYDVERICEDTAASRTPTDVAPKTSFILLHVQAGGVLQQEAINMATAAFLLAVNGSNSFSSIVDHLMELFGKRGPWSRLRVRSRVRKVCLELLERGIITFTLV